MRTFASTVGPFFLSIATLAVSAEPVPWQIPLAGNSYFVQGRLEQGSAEGIRLQNPAAMLSAWFHVDRPGDLDLALRLRVPDGKSTLKASLAGKALEVAVDGPEFHVVPLGKIQAGAAGYLRVDLRGVAKSGVVFAEISHLVVSSKTPEMKASFVRDNQGGMFYLYSVIWVRFFLRTSPGLLQSQP